MNPMMKEEQSPEQWHCLTPAGHKVRICWQMKWPGSHSVDRKKFPYSCEVMSFPVLVSLSTICLGVTYMFHHPFFLGGTEGKVAWAKSTRSSWWTRWQLLWPVWNQGSLLTAPWVLYRAILGGKYRCSLHAFLRPLALIEFFCSTF